MKRATVLLVSLVAMLGAIVVVVGCGDDDDNSGTKQAAPSNTGTTTQGRDREDISNRPGGAAPDTQSGASLLDRGSAI